MTYSGDVALHAPARLRAAALLDPLPVFLLFAIVFGLISIVLIPPFRGPDENAHFLRAYAISRGEIIPSQTDAHGRKGLYVPARLNRDLAFFLAAKEKLREGQLGYPDVIRAYLDRPDDSTPDQDVFVLYSGSEGYHPAAYLPFAVAAAVSRIAGLDFLGMLFLMRFVGFALVTAIIAWAIFVLPQPKWAFACIAMLPSAIYARAVVSVDGLALAYTMALVAVWLRSFERDEASLPWARSLWMTLCALTKPPQLAFALLETCRRPISELRQRWTALAIVALPGFMLSAWWLVVGSADVAAWRLTEGHNVRPDELSPVWKLKFMLINPLHFPKVLLASLDSPYEWLKQVIGMLGWLDTPLQFWLYPLLSCTLLLTCLTRLPLELRTRRRVGVAAGLSTLGYVIAVFLVFFLVWTPVDSEWIWGVQGRYFVVALPLVAVAAAAVINSSRFDPAIPFVAAAGMLFAGAGTWEAVLRKDWSLW